MFTVDFKKEDLKEMCGSYWQYEKEGGFVYSLEELAEQGGLDPKEVEKEVKKRCSAVYDGYVCEVCTAPIRRFKVRKEFWEEEERIAGAENMRCSGELVLCAKCFEASPCNLGRLQKEGLVSDQEKDAMAMALITGVYESLNEVEYTFFESLAQSINIKEACTKTGIAPKSGHLILKKLLELQLVSLSKSATWFFVHPETVEGLKGAWDVHTVFASRKAEKLYRLLKRHHDWVYPEIRIASFVEYGAVEHVLQESWEKSYFYKARVDFLICTLMGMPLKVVEFDGGYHGASSNQRFKDGVKEKILAEAGLEVERYTSADLHAEGG